jgi:hypothetical protein
MANPRVKVNTTVRENSDVLEIVDELAKARGVTQSELIRTAIIEHIRTLIDSSPGHFDAAASVAQRSLNEHLVQMAETFGPKVVESLVVPPFDEIQPPAEPRQG